MAKRANVEVTENKNDTTPHHEHRRDLAKRAKDNAKKSDVKEEWYEFTIRDPQNKKGRKVIRHLRTEAGVHTVWVGWEKKIPKAWLSKTVREGLFKNLTSEDQKVYATKGK